MKRVSSYLLIFLILLSVEMSWNAEPRAEHGNFLYGIMTLVNPELYDTVATRFKMNVVEEGINDESRLSRLHNLDIRAINGIGAKSPMYYSLVWS